MKKTSVSPEPGDLERLAWPRRSEGASQAEIIRKAIAAYVPKAGETATSARAAASTAPGNSVADLEADELLGGFGEHALRP